MVLAFVGPRRLRTALSGAITTSVLIDCASGVTFDASTDLVVGTATIFAADVTAASNTGAIASLNITASAHSMFNTYADLVIGSSMVPASDIVTARGHFSAPDEPLRVRVDPPIYIMSTVEFPRYLGIPLIMVVYFQETWKFLELRFRHSRISQDTLTFI